MGNLAYCGATHGRLGRFFVGWGLFIGFGEIFGNFCNVCEAEDVTDGIEEAREGEKPASENDGGGGVKDEIKAESK